MNRMTVLEIPEVRRLLVTVARRNYPPAELRQIVRGWRRDLDALLRRTRRTR